MGANNDILEEAQEAFRHAAEAESDNRVAALDDLRFGRLGEQWDEEQRRQRDLDHRPCLTINRLPAFMRQVVNDARQNKPSIKCHPADSKADPATALVMNGLIRNIEYASNADVAYDTAAEFAVSAGFGYWRVSLGHADERSFDLDIRIDAIANPFSVYGDPHSTSTDSADWNSAFVTELMEKDSFERQYRGADAVDWQGAGYAGLQSPWREGEKVLTAEWWRREQKPVKLLQLSDGTILTEPEYEARKDIFDAFAVIVVRERDSTTARVRQYILTGAEVLETNDWAGKYIPMVPVYGEAVNVEGKRYLRSLIRDARDPQRMFNYWRTASAELVALAPKAPFIGPVGSFSTDIDKWLTANIDSHAFLEYDVVNGVAQPPQRQPFAGPPAGALQEALNASDDMKSVMGLYDASMGARSNETSGKAILARQREGDVSTFHFIDNVRRAIRHTGRILIDLIPKVYTGQRIVRVLGEDGKTPQNVQLASLQQQPRVVEGVQRLHDFGLGKYDLTIETGPSFTTQREEAASMIIEMVRAWPAAAPVVMDILARNMDWPGADEIARRLQLMASSQIRGEDPRIAAMAQELASLKSDRSLEQEKLRIDAFNAQTNRLKALLGARHSSVAQRSSSSPPQVPLPLGGEAR